MGQPISCSDHTVWSGVGNFGGENVYAPFTRWTDRVSLRLHSLDLLEAEPAAAAQLSEIRHYASHGS